MHLFREGRGGYASQVDELMRGSDHRSRGVHGDSANAVSAVNAVRSVCVCRLCASSVRAYGSVHHRPYDTGRSIIVDDRGRRHGHLIATRSR
jgi:hypothetical protein